jgi:lysophospholipase L1-like esterase
MAYMKDSTGRRLDTFAVADRPRQPTALPATHALTKQFDSRRSIYNATSDNGKKARIGLTQALAGNGLFRILCAGDSITRGLSVSGITWDQSYPARLRSALKAAGHVCAGDGFVVPAGYDAPAVVDSRWAYTGTWNHNYASSGYTWGARGGAIGSTAMYTTAEPCTSISMHWFNGIGNAVTIEIDGVAPASNSTVTPAGGTTIGSVTWSGLANTTHTIKVTMTGTSFVLHGFDCTSANGFVVDNFGRSGSSTDDWVLTGWKDHLTLAMRPQIANTAGTNLTILGLGTNDALRDPTSSNGASPAQYSTQLQSIITAIKASSELMLIAPPPIGNYFDAAAGMAPYSDAIYTLAESNNLRVLDMYDRWVSYTDARNGNLISTDTTHPSVTGYYDYREAVLALIGVK